jgi:TonB family protein
MTLLEGKNRGARKPLSFLASAGLHGVVLSWMVLGPPLPGSEPPRRSLYDQEIRPNEKKIVWYTMKEKLPDISPSDKAEDPRPPRAKELAKQTMVSGEKDDEGATQRIWMPAPEVELPKPLPLPNVVAVAPPKVYRPFVAPEDVSKPKSSPVLPDAPKVSPTPVKTLAMELPKVKPAPIAFTAAAGETPKPKSAPALPDAPKVASATAAVQPIAMDLPKVKPTPMAFTPPPDVRMKRQAALMLPEAPVTETVVEPNAVPFARGGATPQRRAFVAPAGSKQRNDAPMAIPNAPELATAGSAPAGVKLPKTFVPPPSKPAPSGTRTTEIADNAPVAGGTVAVAGVKLPKTFVPPPSRPAPSGGAPGIADDVPMVGSVSGTPNQASLAIVGLNPTNTPELPSPPGSRAAGFSAGPEKRPTGGTGSTGGAALLGVPGLLVRNGANDAAPTRVSALGLAPTSRENLALAAKTVGPMPPPPPPPTTPAASGALRVTESPDPRLSGREVYSTAIQMPNVTSYSGSWLVWFAEHDPIRGSATVDMKAPVPLHKVDPKYIAAAAAEHVEGKVRLYGVIRKDGRVDSIALIQHVDVRLDQSAAGALAQWVFEPALRNGRPVDVDAVFEIPFHLAPRATK